MFSIATDSKIHRKDSDLFDILYSHFGKTINKARIRFMAMMVAALCKMQTVSFGRLALAFGSAAEASSNMRRMQRFMSGYALDLSLIARLIFRLLPHQGPYTLSMDRTNWEFGGFKVNALVLGVTYEGVAFPLLFRLLPKKGNSNTAERNALVTIAFLWAYLAGISRNRLVRKIRMLNNGRKAVSLFKYGLDYIAECLLNPERKPKFDIFQILSCT